jgi:hypothetical protein
MDDNDGELVIDELLLVNNLYVLVLMELPSL